MAQPAARSWLLDRKIVANEVGLGLIDATRTFLETLEPRPLAEYLIGGLATSDLPDELRPPYVALARESTGVREYLMPPLPNTHERAHVPAGDHPGRGRAVRERRGAACHRRRYAQNCVRRCTWTP